MNLIELFQKPTKQATLCFLVKNKEILLAMKNRGFGVGRWNGVGGKPNPGESIEQTVVREAQEEINVIPQNLVHKATLDFNFSYKPEWNQQVIVYFSDQWQGTPTETEEMKPQWFKKDQIPYDSMWPDDKLWLPLVLEGKNVNAQFVFGDNDEILDYRIN